MSCEKVKIHLPSLCKPNENCKKIGNPLSYYNRMIWIIRKESKEQSSDNETTNNKSVNNKSSSEDKK